METAAFWIDRMGPAKRDELLAPESRIRRLNRRALEIPACEVNDVFGEADPEGVRLFGPSGKAGKSEAAGRGRREALHHQCSQQLLRRRGETSLSPQDHGEPAGA